MDTQCSFRTVTEVRIDSYYACLFGGLFCWLRSYQFTGGGKPRVGLTVGLETSVHNAAMTFVLHQTIAQSAGLWQQESKFQTAPVPAFQDAVFSRISADGSGWAGYTDLVNDRGRQNGMEMPASSRSVETRWVEWKARAANFSEMDWRDIELSRPGQAHRDAPRRTMPSEYSKRSQTCT